MAKSNENAEIITETVDETDQVVVALDGGKKTRSFVSTAKRFKTHALGAAIGSALTLTVTLVYALATRDGKENVEVVEVVKTDES